MTTMHWYNPTTRRMEEATQLMSEAQAIEMLSGVPDSDEFIERYRRWRETQGLIEALIYTGEYYRVVHAGRTPPL
jgi:uncharacterized short protein YbdD (DUF466 family)